MLVPAIIAYDVINCSNRGSLVNAVNKYISQGWQPLGPVIKYSGSDFYQTMVKYEQPKPNSI